MSGHRTGDPSPNPTSTTSAGQPLRRRLVLNTLSTGLGNAWAMVVMLATLPLLLRGLGADAFGVWVLLQTFSGVNGWLSLADLGVGFAMTRLVAGRAAVGDHHGARQAVTGGLAILGTVGVVSAGTLAVLGPLTLPRLFNVDADRVSSFRVAIVVFAANVLGEVLIRGIGAALEGFQRVDLARGVDAARRTVVAVATVTVALAGGGLVGVVTASTVATGLALFVAVGTLVAQVRKAGDGAAAARPRSDDVAELLRYGSTVGALNAAGVLHRVMDKLIVGTLFGPTGVALIEVAIQIQNGASAILSATSYAAMSSSPWLQARGDEDALRKLLLRGTRYCMLVTLPVVAVVAVLAEPIVRLWVGPRFAEAAGLTVVALLYIGLASPMQVGQNLLQGVGSAALVLRAAAVAVAVNLVVSIVLANAVGLVGVLQGTLVSLIVLLPPMTRSVLRVTGTTMSELTREAFLPAILPSLAVMSAVAGVTLVTGLPDLALLVVAGLAASIVFVPAALRWGIADADLSDLRRRFRRGTVGASGDTL